MDFQGDPSINPYGGFTAGELFLQVSMTEHVLGVDDRSLERVSTMIPRRPQAKASRLWTMWCDSHPAPRITVAFLALVLMLAALALARPTHVPDAAHMTSHALSTPPGVTPYSPV
jgi:hypothetical protein